jgi:hypothetical protein
LTVNDVALVCAVVPIVGVPGVVEGVAAFDTLAAELPATLVATTEKV